MPQSPDIWQNSDESISDFRISDQSFINENCHNSRTTHDIDMKLESVTKLDKRNTATSKIFDDDDTSATWNVSVFFQFMVNLQPFGSRIPDAWSIKLTFSLTITFYPTKNENRTKTSLSQLPH